MVTREAGLIPDLVLLLVSLVEINHSFPILILATSSSERRLVVLEWHSLCSANFATGPHSELLH